MSRVQQPPQEFPGALARVHASAVRIRQLRDELAAEYERRGEAVVAAVAEGQSYGRIARAAESTKPTIYKIVTDWA